MNEFNDMVSEAVQVHAAIVWSAYLKVFGSNVDSCLYQVTSYYLIEIVVHPAIERSEKSICIVQAH